ncbi:pyridoxal phosphate-dependent aminotransferase family protein [Nocardia sp. NPDC005998]|uniref:aminotransferase class I/II-fold pyridoxal phosphate-dependent enzyme n=1 Tax=Nocardia sp. NPDC005998 TaxID=3156894 RepID=UPI0033BAB569
MSEIMDRIIEENSRENRRTLIGGMFSRVRQYDVTALEVRGRQIRVTPDHWVTDFASCNYLGLDLDPEMTATVAESIDRWGVHPSWCRLVASPELYVELEERLAKLVGTEAALILPTVTLISIGVIPALVGKNGVLLLDKSGHETMYEAAKIARDNGATLASFVQGDLDRLATLLDQHRANPRKVILVDGVYSMTGDHADLHELLRLAAEYHAVVYVDDAHGFGVVGENPSTATPFGQRGNGIVRHLGLDYDNVLYVGGCSKAYSSLAAFVACSKKMQTFIKTFATPYDLSGPSPTASLATLWSGLDINDSRGDVLRERLWKLTDHAARGIRELGYRIDNRTGFPILSVEIGDPDMLATAANHLFDAGILVTTCPYPMVARGQDVLRLTLTAANTDAEVDHLIAAFSGLRELLGGNITADALPA